MLDVLIALVLVTLGVIVGRKTAPKQTPPPVPEAQELQRLQEERTAFAQLMGYNAERAYSEGGWGNGL